MRDKFRISGGPHFRNIQARNFNFRTHAVGADPSADQAEDDAPDDDIPTNAGRGRDDLGDQLLQRMIAIEEANHIS